MFPKPPRLITEDMLSKLDYRGSLQLSLRTIIAVFFGTFIQFGAYFRLLHNCQFFCTAFLFELGLNRSPFEEDARQLAAITGLVAAAAILGAVYAYKRFKK